MTGEAGMEPGREAPMTSADFTRGMKRKFVTAYPVISGVPFGDDADEDEIEFGFQWILQNQNLQVTLRSAMRGVTT